MPENNPIDPKKAAPAEKKLSPEIEALAQPLPVTAQGSFYSTQAAQEPATRVEIVSPEADIQLTTAQAQDAQLWDIIRTRGLNFDVYRKCMDSIIRCDDGKGGDHVKYRLPFTSSKAYGVLKFATEAYVRILDLNESDRIPAAGEAVETAVPALAGSPYLDRISQKISDFTAPATCKTPKDLRKKPLLIELIWNYWHEEGMLTQTMHAIAMRFQNMRSNGTHDPLANLEIDCLRPMNNVLWGYIQDAQHRLTAVRRAYEYDHHYGIKPMAKLIPNFNPADSRSKFIESFHNLLYRCTAFYKESDDRMRNPDAFPVLNALKEVHMLLSEGAHNQFGDLPTTARVEMLMEQWILAQPEIREFLGGRVMTPYDEPWMDRVDTMKTLQGWPQTSVSHYHDLGKFGEQVLLSIRWADWSQVNDRQFAAIWANGWRNEIQRYIYCYQAVTGVDLGMDSVEVNATATKALMPSVLIQRKFQQQRILKRNA